MQFLLAAILLLIVPKVSAQDNISSPSSTIEEELINTNADINQDIQLDATKSATISAADVATSSANQEEAEDILLKDMEDDTSTKSPIIDQDTTKTALIYTGIMVLILIAFLAGRKSSELDNDE